MPATAEARIADYARMESREDWRVGDAVYLAMPQCPRNSAPMFVTRVGLHGNEGLDRFFQLGAKSMVERANPGIPIDSDSIDYSKYLLLSRERGGHDNQICHFYDAVPRLLTS